VVTILYFQFVKDGQIFHKPKTQNSDRLETNWKSKIVTVFNKPKIQNSDRLQQTENTKNEGGHYFVFSICLKTVTMLYFRFVEGGHYFVFSVC
jgi:hypothetical protein